MEDLLLRPRASFLCHLRPSPDFILQFPNAAIYSLCKTPPSLAFSTVLPLSCQEAEPQELPPRKAVSACCWSGCQSHLGQAAISGGVAFSNLLLGSILTLSGDPGSYQGTNPVNYFGSVPTSCFPLEPGGSSADGAEATHGILQLVAGLCCYIALSNVEHMRSTVNNWS